MNFRDLFAPDYPGARASLLRACEQHAVSVVSLECPARGPDGVTLYTDVGLAGPERASRVLLVTTGVHGVEGYAGSAILHGWLASGAVSFLSPDTRLVLVHALNPYGFAWRRRVDEHNVDVDREGLDLPRREGPAHAGEVRAALAPRVWSPQVAVAAVVRIRAFEREHGSDQLARVMRAAQSESPRDLFYSGREPSWSRRTFAHVVDRFVRGSERVAYVDFHTGFGPYGAGQLWSPLDAGPAERERLRAWYSHPPRPAVGVDTDCGIGGGLVDRELRQRLAGVELTGIRVEFGTYPSDDVWCAMIAENWLHARPGVSRCEAAEIEEDFLQSFYPDELKWRDRVMHGGIQILDHALAGVSGA